MRILCRMNEIKRISVITMKKKKALVLALSILAILSTGVACAELSEMDKYEEKGYKISVTYDANGGSFMSRPGVTVVDMFNPDNYEEDANGAIHIKLVEPTSKDRPLTGDGRITLSKSGNFYAGWYATREVKTTEDGKPVDAAGNVIVALDDGTYVYPELDEKGKQKEATPAYIYSDLWDFENDTIDYVASDYKNGVYSLTLYAGWVEDYAFDYYYKTETDAEWTKMNTSTSFDYKSVKSSDSDKDTIWVPRWDDGAMNYKHAYISGGDYSFPKIEGTTFVKAYADAACTQEITGSYEHMGTLDLETATATGRIQNVYVIVEEGERYKISNAQQFVNNANTQGIYEIQSGVTELDFAQCTWPVSFTKNVFEGKIYTADESVCTLKNIYVKQTSVSSSVAAGGLFAAIANGAELKNLSFEQVTYDLAVSAKTMDMQFGLFAGVIEEGAVLTEVSVKNGLFQIGDVGFGNGYALNLLACGNNDDIKAENLSLCVYGKNLGEYYLYKVNPTTASVDADRNISLTLSSFKVYVEEVEGETKYYYVDEEDENQRIYIQAYLASAEDKTVLYYDI